MTDRKMGQASRAAAWPLVALMLSLAGAGPALAQDTGTPTPAPTPAPSSIFRLPPADDGRAPGVQGPSDNGLPPVAPGERRGAQPTPTPAPSPTQPATPPRVTPTQPATGSTPSPAAPRTAAPVAAPRSAAPSSADAAPILPDAPDDSALLPSLPNVTPNAALPAADSAPAAAAPASAPSDTPLWPWLAALLAALGAGWWYWRRGAVLAGPAVDDDAPPRPVAAPAQPPTPAPRAAVPPSRPVTPPPAPQPAPRSAAPAAPMPLSEARPAAPLVTRAAGEQRALVGMAVEIRSIRFAPDHVAVGFALNLINQGSLPATGLMVRIALNQGSAMPEAVLGRFFDGAGGSVLRDDMVLAVGAGEELSTEVMLPRATIEPLMIGGKPMLVPVIAFDVTYHWDGEGDAFGQNAGSFVIGREHGTSGSDKLAPLPLDRASYLVDRPGARATAVRRSQ